jgi:hypothetical protein
LAATLEGTDSTRGSSPRSRVPAPRAGLVLARGFRPLEQVSASLEASPRPATPHLLAPTGALYALTRRGCLGQRKNPRRTDPLTLPGNLARMLCGQPATVRPSSTPCGCCAEWQVSFLDIVLPLSSFLHAAPLERGWQHPRGVYDRQPNAHPRGAVTQGRRNMLPPSPPTLCGHPQPCATIPCVVEPSPVL